MASAAPPVDQIKSLDGTISEPISSDTVGQSTSREVLPVRPKGKEDVPPPGQTLTGKQEHCTCIMTHESIWSINH